MEPRRRFVVHRVTDDEFQDLALVACARRQSRSETLRTLIVKEKSRLAGVQAYEHEESVNQGGRNPGLAER